MHTCVICRESKILNTKRVLFDWRPTPGSFSGVRLRLPFYGCNRLPPEKIRG